MPFKDELSRMMRTAGCLKLSVVIAALAAALAAGSASASAALTPMVVLTTRVDEYAPAVDGEWFSWTQQSKAHPSHYDVFVRRESESKIRVNPAGTEGGSGGIDGRRLVFYQHKGISAGDIRKFNLLTHRRSDFPSKVSTRWDEYHGTISGPWVLFSRYMSTTRTTKVLLFNMHTGALRTLASDSGRYRYVYSGDVNGDYAVWGRVRPSGQDVFLYRISTKTNTVLPRVVFAQYDPTVASDGTVYFQRSGNECGANVSLIRYPLDGPATVISTFPVGVDGGFGTVDERSDGSLHWYFGRVNCRNDNWDIYKVIDSHSVVVSLAGAGGGTVTSNPVGIDCGTTCQVIFHGGTVVTLTATPDPGSVLSGWSDPSCGTDTACAVTVESDVNLTATFEPGA
jgi:hypothetical protein